MSSIESYYRIKNFLQSPTHCAVIDDDLNPGMGTGGEILSQLNSIREKILAKEDLHLHNYLLKLDIPLHIFGIRWLRLLFGREFALLDLLIIWDAIFADSDHFNLPNYILVAMLIRIRDKLLLSDQTTCLTYLMRYPTNVDVNLILRHALHMLQPKRFERPSNAFVYYTSNKQGAVKGIIPISRKASDPETSYKSPKSGSHSSGEHIYRMDEQITKLQTQNAANSAAQFRRDVSEDANAVAEGYSKNSLDLINLELQNAQTIISIARTKLQSYISTIKNNIPGNSSKELLQALDGIDELCGFLDVKFVFPIHATRPPIDEALEANEQVNSKKSLWKKYKSNDGMTLAGVDTKPMASHESHSVGGKHRPVLADTNSISEFTINAYERPDENVSATPSHLLRGVREIELLTIATSEYVDELTEGQPNIADIQNVITTTTNSGTTQKSQFSK
ncbi:unnamed protein product [Ceratitis capitata]|nr:unnamed protein product [Ceratitis capitata]